MEKHTGFLLSYVKYGDNDAILHLFTREEGFKSFFARGLYSIKSKKKALLQPLIELEFNVNPRKKGMPSISSLQPADYIRTEDVKIYSLLFFMAEFLQNILRNELENKEVYQQLTNLIKQLKLANYDAHIQFMIHFTTYLGVNPLMSEAPFLSPVTGIFETNQNHHLFTHEISDLWKQMISSPYHCKLNNQQRKDLLEGLMVYYSQHVAGFKTPFSLNVLQQLWK